MKNLLNEIVVKGSGVTWNHREDVVKQKSAFIEDYCKQCSIEFKALKEWHVRLKKDLVTVDLFLASHTYHLVEHPTMRGQRGNIQDLPAFLDSNF